MIYLKGLQKVAVRGRHSGLFFSSGGGRYFVPGTCRELWEGTSLFYKKSYADAASLFMLSMKNGNSTNLASKNLSYLISNYHSYLDLQLITHCLEGIYESNKSLDIAKVLANSLLKVDKKLGKNFYEKEYLHKYLLPSIKNTTNNPIFYIHIPKCGGTSFISMLGQHFYGDDYRKLLPSYTELEVFNLSINEYFAEFPFLSSQHIPTHSFSIPNEVRTIAVFRDPLKRVMSMYRQSFFSLKYGYHMNIVAKYGVDWDYWKCKNFISFANNIPTSALCAQTSTFSQTIDYSEAIKSISSLDYVLDLDHRDSNLNFVRLLNSFGIQNRSLPKTFNSSPKSIIISERDKVIVKDSLLPDYQLFDGVKNAIFR